MNGNTNLLLHLTESVAFGYLGYAMHNRINDIDEQHSAQIKHLFSAIADIKQQFQCVARENLMLRRKVKKLQKMFWTYNMGADASIDCAPAYFDNAVIVDLPTECVDDIPDIGYDSDPDTLMELDNVQAVVEPEPVPEPEQEQAPVESTSTEPESIPIPEQMSIESIPVIVPVEHLAELVPVSSTVEQAPIESIPVSSTVESTPVEQAPVQEQVPVARVSVPAPANVLRHGTIWNPKTEKYTKITSKAGSKLYEEYKKSQRSKK